MTDAHRYSAGRPGKIFFDASGKRGEIQEFKEELNHASKEKKKEALKKVIQAMTVGSDVSSLFPDVVSCMQTQALDLKKLVYLYVINYAKAQPDLAILAINSFRKDANDPQNALLRALAVRTMGYIRLEQMTEYLLEPLRRSCQDPDPYVRKTATICIAKLYDINPELVEDQDFINILRDMIGDSNPMVVANAVASLCEISCSSGRNYMQFNEDMVSRLLLALNECSEWGQVFILDALAMYDPPDSRVAETILDRGVIVRLSHANSAVVLSTVKVMMKFMDKISVPEMRRAHCKKIAPPLVTLLNASEPEIQYVVMRNINLIVQKQPQILQQDVRMFVCKYNDPLYVKLEKIAVMVQLASKNNIDQLLSEFREYASEVAIECVRRSVQAIGQCAIKLSQAAERCVDCLLDLIKTKVNYVVQEAIIVIRDIFRKYPGKYEIIISDLCENLDSLDEPEAKASMIWIIGEYAERIDNSNELLEAFLESFHEEPAMVQLQLLTATVKLCLKCPQTSRELVSRVLKVATDECNNPDLRDRGYMYWRLLSSNPEVAKQIVLSERPNISDDSFATQPRLLDRLVTNISTLASVYHQPPEAFLIQDKSRPVRDADSGDEDDNEQARENLERVQQEMRVRSNQGARYVEESDDGGSEGSGSGGSSSGESHGQGASGGAAGAGVSDMPPPPPLRPLSIFLSEQMPGQNGNKGLRFAATVVRGRGGAIGMQIMVGNFTSQVLNDWAVLFNKNSFGFGSSQLQLPNVPPGGTSQAMLSITPNQQQQLSNKPPTYPLYLELAIKTNLDVFYISVAYDLTAVFIDSSDVGPDTFQQTWQRAPQEQKMRAVGQFGQQVPADKVLGRIRQYFGHSVAQWSTPTPEIDYMCFVHTTVNHIRIFSEMGLQRQGTGLQLVIYSDVPNLVPIFRNYMGELLQVRWQGGPGS